LIVEGASGRFVGDRYHIVRELGRGGMGVVYLGRDLQLDMDVAIKFRGVTHHDATMWLKREFRSVASLRHRNLVELYELVAHDKSCYFTMEYLRGIDPRKWVLERPPSFNPEDSSTRTVLPLQEAHTETSGDERPRVDAAGSIGPAPIPIVEFTRVRSVLTQLAEGLAFLHGRGVIHRDVKPSNTMVLEDGSVKLLDFGLALESRRQEESVTRETRVVGTVAYLAPEYVSGLVVSTAMDVYSLGVLAFELCTGAPPFGGTLNMLSRLQKSYSLPRARAINPDTPPDLDVLIDDMLSPDPAKRPTAHDVLNRLTGQLSQPRPQLREHHFIGREAELGQLVESVVDSSAHGRAMFVIGPSGVGKTALIDEMLSRVRDADAVEWRGRCHERERVPYRAFDQIIDDLATELARDPHLADAIDHPGALARVFPALGAVIQARNEPVDLRVERERALIAMTQLFRRVVRAPIATTQLFRRVVRAPRAMIVIDDLQWADDDSLELLALLVERMDLPLTVVASWTTLGPIPDRLRALLDRLATSARVVDVPAMADEELVVLIGELAPRASLEQVTTAAHLAQGSPYLAELIGRELGEERGLDSAGSAEERRLARLHPMERAVAEIASLAGGTATFPQLRALASLSSAQLRSVLRGLEDSRIVRAIPSATGDPVYAFYHERLREVAHAMLGIDARRALHRRFAQWFEEGTGAPDQLAYHWREAGDRTRAAHWAIAAGDAARAQLAWAIAADWYARALEVDGTTALREKRAEMLFLGGQLADAAGEFLVLARGEPARADAWRVRAAEAYIKLGELDRGLALLDGVLEIRGQRRAANRVASVLRAAGVAARWLSPFSTRPLRRGDDVLPAAYRVIASFLSTPYPIESLEYVLRGVALAERSGDRAAYSMGMSMLSAYIAIGTLGRFGDRAIAKAEKLAAQSGEPYSRMVAAGAAGMLATLRGDWAGMRASHEAGARICDRLGLDRSWEASFLRTYWALGEYYAGDPARALELLDQLVDASDDLFGRAMIGSCRGRVLVVAGKLSQARGLAAELDRSRATRQGMAAVYRDVFAAELALAEHNWMRARSIGDALAKSTRSQWLSAMPAISAMIDVVTATADIGLAQGLDGKGREAAAARARSTARRLHSKGRASFYAATALRLWAQAERLLDHDAGPILARAADVASRRGGKLDRLAISALAGAAIDPGTLRAAVVWSTGGMVRA
jgi:eukaryotic-like serine/threonine-protein kinase